MRLNLKVNRSFLSLLRLGIGNSSPQDVSLSKEFDWEAVRALADKQGLSAVILDGIGRLSDDKRPSEDVLLEWIGDSLYYDALYEDYRKAIRKLAGFYNQHGFKMMVVKGLACSLDWPKPSHRPCGDIDIWQFGKQRIADEVIERETGIEVDSSHHHHTVFYWGDYMVENHYDFINVHHHRSNAELEKILKDQARDDSHFLEIKGEKVYLPSPNLHALFLLRHAMMHFAATEITLKNLLDWGFFVQAHGKEVDWKWLLDVLERFGMKQLFNIFNAICIEDLGFDKALFLAASVNAELKERVLKEILDPEIPNEKPSKLLARAVWKLNRWKANEWKHRLCYKESMWSAFWSGVWNHLLKPSSI